MQTISQSKFQRILEHCDYTVGYFDDNSQVYYTICLQGKWVYVQSWDVEKDSYKWYREDLSKVMSGKFAQAVVNFVVGK